MNREPKRPIRLTRRGRIVVVAFAVLVVLGLGAGGRVAFAGPPSSGPEVVVVEPGDTLWDIAVAAEPRKDPRLVVARILELNHLSGVLVEPGQEIVLP